MKIIAFLILMTSATFAQVAASHTSKSDAEKIASSHWLCSPVQSSSRETQPC